MEWRAPSHSDERSLVNEWVLRPSRSRPAQHRHRATGSFEAPRRRARYARLTEARRGKLDLGEVDLRVLGQRLRSTCRCALVTLRVVPIEETQGQRVPEADGVEVARGRLSDPRIPSRQGVAEPRVGMACEVTNTCSHNGAWLPGKRDSAARDRTGTLHTSAT